MAPPSIVFYGDDFTGATDALGTATRAGLRTLLFLAVPDDAQLARAGELDCVGIAGAARSMAPDRMREALAPMVPLFLRLGARVLHYKCCSTFDSAPEVGSIGVAVEVLREAVAQRWVAIVGGQPVLERYCLFGQLFAAAGNGGAVQRIDRHPTMSRHPVTPMHEADLRLHLAAQGLDGVQSLPYPVYERGEAALRAAVDTRAGQGAGAVLFDVARQGDLASVGAELRARAQVASLLAVGPSSVLQAVAPQRTPPEPRQVEPSDGPVFVLAGSLSPVTARQVAAARSFETVWLDPRALAAGAPEHLDALAQQLASRLVQGRHVLACTAQAVPDAAVSALALANAGGALLARVLAAAPVRRVGVAGGDTSSLAVQALDAWGLSYLATLSTGAPLCRLHSDQPGLDGCEILLKGGQMGDEDVFERLVHGTS